MSKPNEFARPWGTAGNPDHGSAKAQDQQNEPNAEVEARLAANQPIHHTTAPTALNRSRASDSSARNSIASSALQSENQRRISSTATHIAAPSATYQPEGTQRASSIAGPPPESVITYLNHHRAATSHPINFQLGSIRQPPPPANHPLSSTGRNTRASSAQQPPASCRQSLISLVNRSQSGIQSANQAQRDNPLPPRESSGIAPSPNQPSVAPRRGRARSNTICECPPEFTSYLQQNPISAQATTGVTHPVNPLPSLTSREASRNASSSNQPSSAASSSSESPSTAPSSNQQPSAPRRGRARSNTIYDCPPDFNPFLHQTPSVATQAPTAAAQPGNPLPSIASIPSAPLLLPNEPTSRASAPRDNASSASTSNQPPSAPRRGRARSNAIYDFPPELSSYLHRNPGIAAQAPTAVNRPAFPTTYLQGLPLNHRRSPTEASPPITTTTTVQPVVRPAELLNRARSALKKLHPPTKTDTSVKDEEKKDEEEEVEEEEEPAQLDHRPRLLPRRRDDSDDNDDNGGHQGTMRPTMSRSSSQETIRPEKTTSSTKSSGKAATTTKGATGPTSSSLVPLACPPWDRCVDITWSRTNNLTWSGAKELTAFRTTTALMARQSGHMPTTQEVTNPFCRLPDRIRYLICKNLVEDQLDSQKLIRLNTGRWLYKGVWPVGDDDDETFVSLEFVLAGLDNYMAVCHTLRTDMLATLLNTRRFHLVLSPFPLAKLDPVGHSWFGRYGGYCQFLTVEVDFARLGMGKGPNASLLSVGPFVERVEARLRAWAAVHKSRALYQKILLDQEEGEEMTGRATASAASTVHDLTVTVRRYFGHRPGGAERDGQMYSDDKYLAVVLAPLGALRGKVDRLRVVGTSIPAANDLIASVWDVNDEDVVDGDEVMEFPERWGLHTARRSGPSFYPSLPGQASVLVDANDGEYYYQHPGAYQGVRDYVCDETFVRGQLVVGNPEAAGGRDKSKGREKEKKTGGPPGSASGNNYLGGEMATTTEPFPDVPNERIMRALLEEDKRRAAAVADETEGGAGGKLRQFSGRLQKKMSKLVLRE